MKKQCADASVCPANALPGSDFCAAHLGKRGGGDDEALLPFDFEPKRNPSMLIARVQRPFTPKGLMLWNVDGLDIEAILLGRDLQLVCSFGRIPAAWFAVSQSFEQVVQSFADGKDPGKGWGRWSTAWPGGEIQLRFDNVPGGILADNVRALMWGHVLA